MTPWYRRIEQAADSHPWRFSALGALFLSAFAGALSVAGHQPAPATALQLLIWGPGWFALSGLTSRLRQRLRSSV